LPINPGKSLGIFCPNNAEWVYGSSLRKNKYSINIEWVWFFRWFSGTNSIKPITMNKKNKNQRPDQPAEEPKKEPKPEIQPERIPENPGMPDEDPDEYEPDGPLEPDLPEEIPPTIKMG